MHASARLTTAYLAIRAAVAAVCVEPRLRRRAAVLGLASMAVGSGLAWTETHLANEPARDPLAAALTSHVAQVEASATAVAQELAAEREDRLATEAALRERLATTDAETVALRLRLGADQAKAQRLAGAQGDLAQHRAADGERARRLTAELAATAAQAAQGAADSQRLAAALAKVQGELDAFRKGITILDAEPVPPPLPDPPPTLDDRELADALATAREVIDGYADPGSNPAALEPILAEICRATCSGAAPGRIALLELAATRRLEVQALLETAIAKRDELKRLMAPVAAQNADGAGNLSDKAAKKRIELELTHRLVGIRKTQLVRADALEKAVLDGLARHAPQCLVERLAAIVGQAQRKKLLADPIELARIAGALCEHRVADAAPVLAGLLEELALARFKAPVWTKELVRAALVSLARGRGEGVSPPPSEKEAS